MPASGVRRAAAHVQDVKHVCEYSQGKAYCGTVLPISSSSLAPLSPALQDHVSMVTDARADPPRPRTSDAPPLQLPPLALSQPCKVLLESIARMRNERRDAGPALRRAQETSGTFDGDQLQMLRHAFVMLCGTDGERDGLPPSKLPELAVMAGLDATDEATSQVISRLVRPIDMLLFLAPSICLRSWLLSVRAVGREPRRHHAAASRGRVSRGGRPAVRTCRWS